MEWNYFGIKQLFNLAMRKSPQPGYNWYVPVIRCLLFILLMPLPFATVAQPQHIKFTSITSRDGLLSNSVNAIVKDRYGLMWFATDDGLNKFDGTNFTVYRHKSDDSFSLRANEILSLHEDRQGNLWVGTSGGAVSLYDRSNDRFINYPLHGNEKILAPNSVVRSICSDYTGEIWIAEFACPYTLDPATGQLHRMDIAPYAQSPSSKMSLFCVFEDSRRRMWIGTDSGLFLYVREKHIFKQFRHNSLDRLSLPNNNVMALGEDKAGNLWVGTGGGLYMMYPDESGFVSCTAINGTNTESVYNQINAIAADKDGMLWVATVQGLYVLDTHTGRAALYLPEEGNGYSLTSRAVRSVYIDNQGIYWFGTFQGGINKYDKNLNLFDGEVSGAFRDIGPGSSIVNAFAGRKNGNVFVGTDGGGLYEFNRVTKKLRAVNILPGLSKAIPLSVLALEMASNGKLYIGTYAEGLIILDTVTGKSEHLTMGPGLADLNANDFFCIKQDSRGEIWAGTNGAGVNVLKGDKVVAKYTPKPKASNEFSLPVNGYIRAIEEDRDGNMWIGSHGDGIAVYIRGAGQFKVYKKSNSNLPGDEIQALMLDSRGQMWVGTYGGGLSVFNSKTGGFTNYTEKDGLQNTTIYQILEDAGGSIWVSTNTGISCLDVGSGVFRNYNHNNGLQNNNFAHSSGIRLADGSLFFGGLQGFNYFNPAMLSTNRNVPGVIITDLKVSNKSVAPGDNSPIKEQISIAREIRLAYKQNFALSFVALNYTMSKQNQYAWKLGGFDKDWNYTGTTNTAYYTNLDPGTYIFHVKASNNDGVWSSGDTSIIIYVKPPFWLTIYAYMFYIVAAGSLVLYSRHRGIKRLRKTFEQERQKQETVRMQELDRLKLKFLTNLSHEFRTPIALIMGPVDQLMTEQMPERLQNKLEMIRRNAKRLLNLVNQLLDFRKMEEQELKLHLSAGDLVAFVKDVSCSFTDISERKRVKFSFHNNADRLYVLFDHDKIERILFNLLSNAFKFTLEGGTVSVILQELAPDTVIGQKWVSIKVSDTGIGIPAGSKEKIFERFFQNNVAEDLLNMGTGIGLSITKEFVKMHGGWIRVDSELDKGSIFTVALPLVEATPALPDENGLASAAAVIDNSRTAKEDNDAPGAPLRAIMEKPTVLLVEDNADFRFYLKDNLRNKYKVIEAADGKEGWQKALSSHPQLIISDVSMPGMNGITFIHKLKADKRTSHIPVILLTALTGEREQIEGLGTGANDYITKPFSFEVLGAKIKNLLQLSDTLKTTFTRQIKLLTPDNPVESEDEKLLSRVAGYLEENLASPQLSVELLSKELNMSRSSLYGKLLKITGKKPVEYIRSFKLDKAAILLEKNAYNITEIAYLTGFATPNYFARAFKASFGMHPSEYAARARKARNNVQKE